MSGMARFIPTPDGVFFVFKLTAISLALTPIGLVFYGLYLANKADRVQSKIEATWTDGCKANWEKERSDMYYNFVGHDRGRKAFFSAKRRWELTGDWKRCEHEAIDRQVER
jgi:hypothetical protein